MPTAKILAIDDEEGVLEMIRGHFEIRGFEVHTARDGEEGIALCESREPDVILVDLKMKFMDGDRVIPELVRKAPRAKIFVVSACQDDIMRRRLAGLPVARYFEKPVSILELEKAVREAVS